MESSQIARTGAAKEEIKDFNKQARIYMNVQDVSRMSITFIGKWQTSRWTQHHKNL